MLGTPAYLEKSHESRKRDAGEKRTIKEQEVFRLDDVPSCILWKINYEALSHEDINAAFVLKICDKSEDRSTPG